MNTTKISVSKAAREKSEKTAIVVVSYNTAAYLRDCLASLPTQAADEIIVVDNASSDGSVEMVRREFPSVQLIANDVNVGYGAAVNQAVAQSEADWIFLLNSDTRLSGDALTRLRQHGTANPRAAVIGPRIVHNNQSHSSRLENGGSENGGLENAGLEIDGYERNGSLQPSCYPFPTPFYVFLEESTLGRLVRYLPFVRERYLRTWSHDAARSVPWVLGAAMLLRRRAFDAVGGFDPDFFLYAEEIDLSYRLQQAGWQTDFAPAATVIHEGGATTRNYRTAMAVQFFTSLQRFYYKHYTEGQLARLTSVVRVILLLRLVRESVLLPLTRDAEQRRELRERAMAWRQIIRHFASAPRAAETALPGASSRAKTA